MNNFRELSIWKDAMEIAKTVMSMSRSFPSEEKYGLISQINRSAVSTPSNIAEGCGRNSSKEFCQFLSIALGSSYELETQLILAESFGYLKKVQLDELLGTITKNQKMISKLILSIKASKA